MTTDLGPVAHRFRSQRLTLNYLDWGNADKPLLLLVHGGEDHARSWDWVAQRLRKDWHIVCPDLRGHGDSDWSPDAAYSMDYMTADLAALIRHLGAEKDVSIVAHSFGGALSLRYTGMFPETVRRLAVIEGLATMKDIRALNNEPENDLVAHWRDWIGKRHAAAAIRPRHYPDVASAVARMKDRNPHLSDDQANHLAFWGLRRFETGDYGWKFDAWFRTMMPMDASDPVRKALWGAIECPVLLFHGKESWAKNPAEDGRAAFFRDARVVSMDRAGHWPHHDRLEDFVTELRGFL